MHMSKIAQSLRLLAAAQRVSQEAAEEAVQGQDSELNEQELADVAAKAASEVKPEEGEQETTDAAAAGDEAVATEVPDEGVETATGTEEAAAGEEPAVAEETPAEEIPADEVPPSEIETPAEQELSEITEATETETLPDAGLDDASAQTTDAVADAAVDAELPADDAGAPVESEAAAADAVEAAAEEVAITDTVGEEPAAVEEAAPVQAEAGAEEAQAPAAAPGPATDASEAVQEVVELTEAIAQASSAEEVVKQAAEAADGLREVADTAEVINENGGVTMESLAMLKLAVRPYAQLLQRGDLNLGVGMESFAGVGLQDRLQASLEEIHELIQELDMAGPVLERQRVEALDRVVCALKDALPSAKDRLRAVISLASNSSDDNEGASVQIDDGLGGALSIDGAFPQDLANELQGVALLGKCLIGPYSETAYRSAKAASLLNNAIDFSSTSAFWEKIGDVVSKIVDPRCNLTRTQLESSLPGGMRLFGEATPEVESTNPVLAQLFAFNGNYAPLESAVVPKSSGEATAPALSASKIVLVGNALQEIVGCEQICERLCEGQKLWPEAQDMIRQLKENLGGAPQQIDYEAGADFSQLIKYVEVNYALATWPLLNYLSNLVLTTNAFVLFAERSLKAKKEAVPTEEAPAAVITPPAEDAAPAADAAPAKEDSLDLEVDETTEMPALEAHAERLSHQLAQVQGLIQKKK